MQEHIPNVTVIIPTFNCERYIADTIESILSQTHKNIELIVVDDGSTDRTCEIVKSYGKAIRLVVQSNAGVCAARNHGLREALGEYICLIDHDDYWLPNKLQLQLQKFKENPEVGIVYSSFISWSADANGKFPDPASFDMEPYGDGIDPDLSGWIYHQFLLDCWMLTSSAMFSAKVFETCGVFDESLPYSEDWELWLRIARKYPFVCLKRPTTLYRQHSNQGNRKIRTRDYRTELLLRDSAKWGLASQDGRSITHRQFQRQIAAYHAGFGFSQLSGGELFIAVRSFIKAWKCSPTNLKYLAYVVASLIGWKPNWK